MTPSWTITYDDGGEELQTASASGKLSLDSTWAFILDTSGNAPVIVLAVPQHRIIQVEVDES